MSFVQSKCHGRTEIGEICSCVFERHNLPFGAEICAHQTIRSMVNGFEFDFMAFLQYTKTINLFFFKLKWECGKRTVAREKNLGWGIDGEKKLHLKQRQKRTRRLKTQRQRSMFVASFKFSLAFRSHFLSPTRVRLFAFGRGWLHRATLPFGALHSVQMNDKLDAQYLWQHQNMHTHALTKTSR